MSSERRLKGLRTRQKSLLASFDLIKIFVDNYEEKQNVLEVPVRLEHLTKLWTDLNQVQSELETLDEGNLDELLKQRTVYESSYYQVKGFLLSVNKPTTTQPLPSTSSAPNFNAQFPASSSHIRLPDVKLPTFSGNLDNWLNFHDLYVSLVHASADLSNIQKFYYLRSSLVGDALKLVQTIPISAANYPIAWNLLTDHFQNPARLKQSYLDALFDFPTLKRETATELHSLVEKFEANVKILRQLGERTEFWDIILIRMLSIRLDPTTRRDWEEYCSTKEIITFQDLTSFIQRRVSVLQTLQNKAPEANMPIVPKKMNPRSITCHSASQQFNNGRKCIVCNEHHPLYLCPSFSKLDLHTKEKEVRRLQLCKNCLRKGHVVRDCPSSSCCRKCHARHHTQLCSGENVVAANSRTTSETPHSKPVSTATAEQDTLHALAASTATHSPTHSEKYFKRVLLATAIV